MSTGAGAADRFSGVEPGTELGGYRVESVLGRGGMGVVYQAHDLALDRKVALKLLAPELAGDVGFRERFHRESRLAASLDHPSIVPIYDAGEVGGQLYIAMRLVEGTDLKRLLAEEGPLEPQRALAILGQVADALDTAHERGLVHRDVKPSNVLIDTRDHVYLADFGLSRLVTETGGGVGDGHTLGTVGYVSPEQIRGDELDGRSDLYSLGCMLYECLTGRPPFTGSDTAVVFAHLQEQPPSVTGPDPVIAKALAKESDERFQSGRELIDAAGAALGAHGGRRRRGLFAAGGLAAAVVAGAVVVTLLWHGGVGTDPTLSSLVHIDATRDAEVGTTPVGRGATSVAANGADVWVANGADGSIWRFRGGATGSLRIPVTGHPTGVATDGHEVLVASSSERTLTLIDPVSGSVQAIRRRVGAAKGAIRVGAGPVTVRYADASPGVVGAIVPKAQSGASVSETTVPRPGRSFLGEYESFAGLAVDRSYAWASGGLFDHALYRIPTTIPGPQAPVARIPLPFAPGSVAAGGGLVWVAGLLDDRVVTIDPSFGRNRVIGTVAVPRGVVGLAYASGMLWIASAVDPVVSRLDPRTGTIAASVSVRGTPIGIAASGDDVWVATAPRTAAPKGGAVAIGILTDCTAAKRVTAERSLAGALLPLLARGGHRVGKQVRNGVEGAEVAGKRVALAQGCADGSALSALAEARRLVESAGVRVLIGPTTATEELALVAYARRHPEVTFVNGSAGAEVPDPPANWFTYHLDDAGIMAGLGAYAYRTLGWRRAAVVGELADPLTSWTQIAGFVREFCTLGGRVVGRAWVPREASAREDFDRALAGLPWKRLDGVVAATGVDPLLALLRHPFPAPKALGKQLVVGPYVEGFEARDSLVHGQPWRGGGPETVVYRAALRRSFPEVSATPGRADVAYRDAMEAVLRGLEASGADPAAPTFRTALEKVALASPDGRITLDARRRARGRNLLVADPGGNVVRRVPGVTAWPGLASAPGTDAPACVAGPPPPWLGRS